MILTVGVEEEEMVGVVIFTMVGDTGSMVEIHTGPHHPQCQTGHLTNGHGRGSTPVNYQTVPTHIPTKGRYTQNPALMQFVLG